MLSIYCLLSADFGQLCVSVRTLIMTWLMKRLGELFLIDKNEANLTYIKPHFRTRKVAPFDEYGSSTSASYSFLSLTNCRRDSLFVYFSTVI